MLMSTTVFEYGHVNLAFPLNSFRLYSKLLDINCHIVFSIFQLVLLAMLLRNLRLLRISPYNTFYSGALP